MASPLPRDAIFAILSGGGAAASEANAAALIPILSLGYQWRVKIEDMRAGVLMHRMIPGRLGALFGRMQVRQEKDPVRKIRDVLHLLQDVFQPTRVID